ncbi:FRD1 [Symbiodinium natans]|uniref:FRD1 protein n=1 Tax=Symbiodinium natans TaxID=878477 RepID=A0A812LXA8_9DINO|nr:FRD1 [Symbiodinium natans]
MNLKMPSINAALETSVESLVADTTKSAGKLARPDLIERLATESSEAVQWLRDRTKVDLSMRSQLGGHTAKRTLRPSNAFVGAELTFAAGQVLTKMAAEYRDRFRLLLKSKWVGLRRREGSEGWIADVQANGTTVAPRTLTDLREFRD